MRGFRGSGNDIVRRVRTVVAESRLTRSVIPRTFPDTPSFHFSKGKKNTKISLLFLSPIPSSSPISLTTRFVYMLIASQFAALSIFSSFPHSSIHSFIHPPPTALSLPLSQQTPPPTPSPSLCLSLSHTLYFPPSRSLSRSLPLSVCQCHSVVEMWRVFLPLCLFFQPKSAEEGKMETFFPPPYVEFHLCCDPCGSAPLVRLLWNTRENVALWK